MNDTPSALGSTCFHDLLPGARFVVRAQGQSFAKEHVLCIAGPVLIRLASRRDAPPHRLGVPATRQPPDHRESLAIQFP